MILAFTLAFYGCIRAKQKVKDCIGPLENYDGSKLWWIIVLSNFFQSTFTDEDFEYVLDFPQWILEHLPEISLTKQFILNKLVKLDTVKALGPDGVHSCVLKSWAEYLANPLYCLLLNSGELPLEWKQANVIPIFKRARKLRLQTSDQLAWLPK